MPLRSNVHADGLDSILRTVLTSESSDILVVNPTADTVERLVAVAAELDGDIPVTRIVTDESTLKDVLDDFIVASNAADLVAAGVLELKSSDVDAEGALVVTEDTMLSLVSAGEPGGALTTDDASFVGNAYETYHEEWNRAEEYTLRTPPLSRVRETLDDELGPETRTDFDAVLSSLQTARGDGEGLDEVTISLLVAAKNEILLYDVSKWGEDVGIASKATFSRTKTRLEDLGLIDTEKVPIDVGRPRLRLKLGDRRLSSVETGELASVAQSLIN